jgi:hypothetical protein
MGKIEPLQLIDTVQCVPCQQENIDIVALQQTKSARISRFWSTFTVPG